MAAVLGWYGTAGKTFHCELFATKSNLVAMCLHTSTNKVMEVEVFSTTNGNDLKASDDANEWINHQLSHYNN